MKPEPTHNPKNGAKGDSKASGAASAAQPDLPLDSAKQVAAQARLDRTRTHRQWTPPDQSLHNLKTMFRRDIERPYKQLGALVPAWEEVVPAALRSHCRLESISRGVLNVSVDSSANLYELDRLLRGGAETRLIKAAKSVSIRRVKLTQAADPLQPGDSG